MFGLKAYLIMGAVMLTMIGGFYWYYKDTQARLALLVSNNAKLELAVKTNEETIVSLQQNFAAANAELTKVNNEFTAVRNQNRELADRLSEHDIAYLASKKPEMVQNIINKASDKAARCFELLSGAQLTDAERNAKDGKSFNSECPWLFDTITR
jgi:regulator of replication initiation timing